MEMLYKHYALKDENNDVLKFFSDAHEKPNENSVIYKETNNKHCDRKAVDMYGIIYKIENDSVIEKSDQERIEDYRKAKLSEIDRACARAMIAGYNDLQLNIDISTSLRAQSNWNNLGLRIALGHPPTVPKKVSERKGSTKMIATSEEIKDLFIRASETIDAIHESYLSKRDEVNQLTDVEDIKNYEV